jgi:repressor LexA
MNMDKTIERLKEYYNLKNEVAIAEKLDIPLSTYRDNYKKAVTENERVRKTGNMLYEVILNLCIQDNLNPNWVFFGKYPRTNGEEDRDAKIISKKDLKDYLNDDTISIPYFTDIAASAGGGCINEECQELEYLVMPKVFLKDLSEKYIQAIKIIGDSMEPNIKSNSVVFIDTNDKEKLNNAVYVVNLAGEIFIKRLEFLDDTVLLKSDNIIYNTIAAKKSEIKIIGKVKNSVSLDQIK